MKKIRILLRAIRIRNISLQRWEEYTRLLADNNKKANDGDSGSKNTENKR